MNRTRITRPGIMKMYARGASRSQKWALPRDGWTISASARVSAVITLMDYSDVGTLRPGAPWHERWSGTGCPGMGQPGAVMRNELTTVDPLKLGLSLLHR